MNSTISGETSPSPDRTTSTPSFDWIMTGLSLWLVTGLFLDGWAHHHLPRLETFFTPWHGVFYSGFLSMTGFLLTHAAQAYRQPGKRQPDTRQLGNRQSGSNLLPKGYEHALLGVPLFWAGAVGDLIWHTLFGIEQNVEALLSPTHLLLAFGIGLMVSGPLLAALRSNILHQDNLQQAPTWRTALPALISLTLVLSLLTFFTQFANPMVETCTLTRNA
jgi:hypothetical protein